MESLACWDCGGKDIAVVFSGYQTAYCDVGCTEDHDHWEDIPCYKCTCRECGNTWDDSSGDLAITAN